MGLRRVDVAGLPKLYSCIDSLINEGGTGRLFVLFCGTTDLQTGRSWCSDCVKGET